MEKKKINWIYNNRPFETVSYEKYLLCVNKCGQLKIGRWKEEVEYRGNNIRHNEFNYNLNYNITRVFSRLDEMREKHIAMLGIFIILKIEDNKKSGTDETIAKIIEHYTYHPIFLSEENFDNRIHEVDDRYFSDESGLDTD